MTRPDDECPDAETLAALVDDTLPAAARRAVEAHVADCHRCQTVMAVIVRTEPAAGMTTDARAALVWWKSRRALTWLATAAAASIGIAVWLAIPGRPAPSTVEPQRQQQAAVVAPAAGPEAESKVADATPQRSRDARSAARPEPRNGNIAPARERALDQAAPAAPASPVPSAGPAADAAVARTAKIAGAVGPIDVVSPNAPERWRIGPGSLVQYSNDGGATWATQQTGASANLNAGSSPAPGVCWIVGDAGTVLRTTDSGRTWLRAPFPDPAEVTSVLGTTALAATVDLAGGRRFGTTDGGQTWVRR